MVLEEALQQKSLDQLHHCQVGQRRGSQESVERQRQWNESEVMRQGQIWQHDPEYDDRESRDR